jgi:hypothetical protein
MFLREIELYFEYLRSQIEKHRLGLASITPAYVREFKENLLGGIDHYRQLAERFSGPAQAVFLSTLTARQHAVADVPDLS